MNKLLKDAVIITAITLISGCLLGLVYEVTKEPIIQAKYNAQQAAYQEVFPGAKSFKEEGAFAGQPDAVVSLEDFPQSDIVGAVAALNDNGEVLGYVVTAASHAGYGGDIVLSIGVQLDGTLNGYAITSISETAGLGMKADEEKFSSQYKDKQVEQFEVIKDTPASDNQIEAISGATITSDAVTDAVNAGLTYAKTLAGGGTSNE